jgi:hypothetical protein
MTDLALFDLEHEKCDRTEGSPECKVCPFERYRHLWSAYCARYRSGPPDWGSDKAVAA